MRFAKFAAPPTAPAAPRNLRLFSQIIPPSVRDVPPQVALRATWEAPLTVNVHPDSGEPRGTVLPNETLYRIKWRLMLGVSGEQGLGQQNRRFRLRRALNDTEWMLYWPGQEKRQDRLTQIRDLIPVTLLGGEMNITTNSWNPTPGQFCKPFNYYE
ncbi:unnamed protein product [Echinostoma caproni]|uniref:Fibronectin type-III domain-containing protein n=1 Tax=Echinostoma caproni TaxID=27848 RepID=A0A183AZB5_9TREM|nr:unnamed protein product [Echinostoma caproni]